MSPSVIYAVGGSSGHAVRGSVLQARMPGATLVVRSGSLPRNVATCGPVIETSDGGCALTGDTLIVDTFPDGWLGRFPEATQRTQFARRALVARAVLDGAAPLPGSLAFDEVWLPYPESRSEWSFPWPCASYLGYLLRPWPREVAWTQVENGTLHVWDPARRLDLGLRTVVAKAAWIAGLRAVTETSGEPVAAEARKFFVLGAGYNTVYETLRQGVDCAFLPVRRRYDDQFRRARQAARAVTTPEELAAWLRAV